MCAAFSTKRASFMTSLLKSIILRAQALCVAFSSRVPVLRPAGRVMIQPAFHSNRQVWAIFFWLKKPNMDFATFFEI